MKRRQLRLNELVKRVVAEAIQFRIKDPRLTSLVSVTRVELSPDYSQAKVFVSILADETTQRLNMRALEASVSLLRQAIKENCELRIVPRVEVVLDDRLEKEDKFRQLLNQAMDGVPTDESSSE